MPKHATRNTQQAPVPRSAFPAPRLVVPLLLSWFTTAARDLPWRRTCDPYAIWVSEIMLQQTQVKTVIPYWERWMHELPTIKSLAKAKPEKIHKLWEGLGYYTRVRNMQKAAQQIIAEHDGQFPQAYDAILALSGIGPYTAGAIASIAFNQPTPILDGNVIRVLTRLHCISESPREKKTNAELWRLAQELVLHASGITRHASPCSHLNQSLMELGALICTPRQPQCLICPLNKLCVASKTGRQEELPNLGKRAASTARYIFAFVIERGGKFLIRQRPAGVVNAYLWEFPEVAVSTEDSKGRVVPPTRDSVHIAYQAMIKNESKESPYHAIHLDSSNPFCVIKHSITRYRITTEAHRVSLPGGTSYTSPHIDGPLPAWRTLPQLHKLAFTSAHKKILAKL